MIRIFQAITAGENRFSKDSRINFVHGSFADLTDFIEQQDHIGKVSGVLLDLGVSSPQLDQAERGFSFMRDGPLDMRMDTTRGLSAAEWIASAEEQDIAKVIKQYGEEKFARRMASAVVRERAKQPITGQFSWPRYWLQLILHGKEVGIRPQRPSRQ